MSDLVEIEPGLGEARVRVRYAETDQMGVVYHANYLVWFEIGRAELIRQMGVNYKDLEREEGCALAVVEVTARYKAPARYDDQLIVQTSLLAVRGAVVRFAYRIVRAADDVLLCEGQSVHLVVGQDMKRRPMPQRLTELFTKYVITSS
jgi:acyl-CoA thioester hydrolase